MRNAKCAEWYDRAANVEFGIRNLKREVINPNISLLLREKGDRLRWMRSRQSLSNSNT